MMKVELKSTVDFKKMDVELKRRIARALDTQLEDERSMLLAAISQGEGPEGPLVGKGPGGGYTASWAEVRRSWGRQSGHIDLNMSSQLTKAIRTRPAEIKGDKIEAAIYINPGRQRAAYEGQGGESDNISIARKLIKQGKKFFGLSKSAKQRLQNAVSKAIGAK